MSRNKSTKEAKLRNALEKKQNLIFEYMRQEWEEADKAFHRQKRKEQLIQFAKNTGAISGKILLSLLLAGGILTIAAVAPNVFAAYGRSANRRWYFKKREFNKNKHYLKRHGFIKVKKRNHDQCEYEIVLTKCGVNKATKEAFKYFNIQKSQTDGYWRVIMFDIPQKYNWARDALRQKLRMMGLRQFQESVFITPYPCEKEINFTVSVLDIAPFVCLIKTKDFSGSGEPQRMFM